MNEERGANRCWLAACPGVEAWSSAWAGHSPPRHAHDAYQISITRVGQGCFTSRGRRVVCSPGEMILIEPGDVHEVAGAGAAPWEFDTLYLDPQVVRGEVGPSPRHRPAAIGASLPSYFARLHRAVVAGLPVIEQEAHLIALVRGLGRGEIPGDCHPPGGAALDRVRDYLDECPGADVSLADLAALADLSPSHLSRSFRRAFGMPPHAYLVQARVRQARSLLRLGTPVAEAAARAGFADQAHLTRHFRRLVGVTPGAYRSGGRNVQDRPGAAPYPGD